MNMKIMQNIGRGVVILGLIILVSNGFKNLDGSIRNALIVLTLSAVSICFVFWIKEILKHYDDHD